jgi:hypothetical protein
MTSGLDRHRNKDGEISRKHANALVGTLRKIYGSTFAAGASDHEKLKRIEAVLNELKATCPPPPAPLSRAPASNAAAQTLRGRRTARFYTTEPVRAGLRGMGVTIHILSGDSRSAALTWAAPRAAGSPLRQIKGLCG